MWGLKKKFEAEAIKEKEWLNTDSYIKAWFVFFINDNHSNYQSSGEEESAGNLIQGIRL